MPVLSPHSGHHRAVVQRVWRPGLVGFPDSPDRPNLSLGVAPNTLQNSRMVHFPIVIFFYVEYLYQMVNWTNF